MSRCPYCRAKSPKFCYRGKFLCVECIVEYATIFDGRISNKMRKRQKHDKEKKGEIVLEESPKDPEKN